MTFKVSIEMDNAAFEESSGVEVARILRSVADAIDEQDVLPGFEMNLRDINGNKVGKATV